MAPDGIPDELRARDQWVLWRSEVRRGRPTKVPYTPQRSYQRARANDPSTWGDWHGTLIRYQRMRETDGRPTWHGIGYEPSAADPYTLIDLDAGYDPDAGRPVPWAQDIVDSLASYTELSPSGTGLHIIIRATLPGQGRKVALTDQPAVGDKAAAVEMYDRLHYVALTGHRLSGTPDGIVDAHAALTALLSDLGARYGHAERQERPRGGQPPRPTIDLLPSDKDLIERAEAAANGPRFTRLWAGDTSMHGGDHSAADQALCNSLAFWTGGDAGRMDRLYRQSGLMRPKWERADYRESTIDKAIRSCGTFYTARMPNAKMGNRGDIGPKSLTHIPPVPDARASYLDLLKVDLDNSLCKDPLPEATGADPFAGGAFRRVIRFAATADHRPCRLAHTPLLQNLDKPIKAASLRVSCKRWRCGVCSARLAGKWLRHLTGRYVERHQELTRGRGDGEESPPPVFILDCPRQRVAALTQAVRKAGGEYVVIHPSGIGRESTLIATHALPGAKPLNLLEAGELTAYAIEQIDHENPPRKPVVTSRGWKLPKAEKDPKWRYITNAKGLDRETLIAALSAAGLGAMTWETLPESVEWALSWLFPRDWSEEQVRDGLARLAAGMPIDRTE